MGFIWSKPPECGCCEWQYSQTEFSRKGELCKPCEKYYSNLGKTEENHDKHLKHLHVTSPPLNGSVKCNCCELSYKKNEVEAVTFECRKNGHVLNLCINCGAHQADSLKCPFPKTEHDYRKCNSQPRNVDKIARKRQEHGTVTPVGY